MQRHHETTCKERADSISHIEVTENMPTNVECENRMPSYCVDVCIYPEPNVEATIMFKHFKLGQCKTQVAFVYRGFQSQVMQETGLLRDAAYL